MYQVGTLLTRLDRQYYIESIQTTMRGTLYTVQCENGDYRRYYEQDLLSKFQVYGEAISVPDNVLVVDFVLKKLVS